MLIFYFSHRSCNEIKVKGNHKGQSNYKNGYYTIKTDGANILAVYCDMEIDAGAFTLLVASRHGNWTENQVILLLTVLCVKYKYVSSINSHPSCNEIKVKGNQKGQSKFKNGYFSIKTDGTN